MRQISMEVIQEVAENLVMDFRCFIHVETLALITFPDEDKHMDFEPGTWKEEIQTIRKGKDNYIEITAMDSPDSFQVMEDFIATVNEPALRNRLSHSIRQRRPFAHFKRQIDDAGVYRDM